MSVTFNQIPSTDARLDRHVEHDDRSYDFAYAGMVTSAAAVTVIHEDDAPVLNQRNVGGCVGFTGADILNTASFAPIRNVRNGGRFYGDQDGLAFYALATRKDDIPGSYPRQDTGSSGLGLAKALLSLGLIDRYLHCFTWEQYLAAIANQPVALGTLWTQRMFAPDSHGTVHVGELNDSTIAGGHEYMSRGHSVERSASLCRNHWDSTWDQKNLAPKMPGEFWLPDADLKLLLHNQGDITVLHGAWLP